MQLFDDAHLVELYNAVVDVRTGGVLLGRTSVVSLHGAGRDLYRNGSRHSKRYFGSPSVHCFV
jgi:hypothetical protein